jgi:precorrin-4 methylase
MLESLKEVRLSQVADIIIYAGSFGPKQQKLVLALARMV